MEDIMHKKKRKYGRRFTDDEKLKIVQGFLESGMTRTDYCENVDIAHATLNRWLREYGQTGRSKKSRYTPEQRKQAVEEYLRSDMSQSDFSKVWGINQKSLSKWVNLYEKFGGKSLEEGKMYGKGKKRGRKPLSQLIKNEIVAKQKLLPNSGLKKLQNALYRFNGIKVSANSIKKTLEEVNEYEPKVAQPKKRKPPQIRRFERARPMQLWQTDITSYVLPRSKDRVYLVVFLDDHSRYIVSWSLGLKQTGSFVIKTLVEGMEKFGRPEEVLSDQGRQYFSWRGRTEFQRLLEREGVRHVVSRSHHPQTLGKCERLWKSVGIEFWDRAKPKTLDDAIERFKHYVNHYNHFRPHQGIDGLVPADRFFNVADQVRDRLEETFKENELRLAIMERPKKPFYFMGQIGDQKITMHGEKGKLVVRTPEGEMENLEYGELGRKTTSKEEVEKTQKKQLQNDCKTSDTSERIMESSEPRAERESPQTSHGDHRLLDGYEDETGSCEPVGGDTFESLADEQAGRVWDVRRAFETTEDEQKYGEQRRRSEISEEEDQGAGSDYRDARQVDTNFEIDAGLSRSDIEKYDEEDEFEEQGSEAWPETEERDTDSRSRLVSENSYWKKDQE